MKTAASLRIAVAVALAIAAAPLLAAPTRLNDRLIEQIRSLDTGLAGVSGAIVLPTGEDATLQLEEFDVYAPGAIVEAIGEGGVAERLPRSEIRFFRGGLAGEVDSLAFLAVGAKGTHGFIMREDRKYRIRSVVTGKPRFRGGEPLEVFIEEVELTDEMSWEEPWMCEVDDFPVAAGLGGGDAIRSALMHVEPNALVSPNATYVLNLVVEGDYELYQRQSSSSTNTVNYLANLVAATSVIYKRDLQTELRIAYSGHHTAVGDPFTMDPATNGSHTVLDALVEFGDRWHNAAPFGGPRSAGMLVSGKDYGSGIAWVSRICQGDFAFATSNYPDGWGGAYGVFMDAGLATNFDPDANPDYQTDLDRFGFEYWPVLAFAHELGHTVQSQHTHCIALTSQEKSDFSVTRNFVDECYSGDVSQDPCYSNGTVGAVSANVPTELGTVMSYCHLTFGIGSATRYTFGQPDEPS
ncbi:MAG: M12 family metallo-peptidase, partial [Thermoanaerobaculia bacterium]